MTLPALRDGFDLIVADIVERSGGIRSLVLAAPGGEELPGFTAGSHLVVGCGEKANAYSLTGEGLFPDRYTISVLRQEDGRGGRPRSSTYTRPDPMRTWTTSRPSRGRRASSSPSARAAPRCRRRSRRSSTTGPSDPISIRAGPTDSWIGSSTRPERPAGRRTGCIRRRSDPRPWIRENHSLPHWRPAANASRSPRASRCSRRSRGSGHAIPNMCRQGVCGECVLPVRRGRPLHRDSYLNDDERDSAIMPCVSRCLDSELELDL